MFSPSMQPSEPVIAQAATMPPSSSINWFQIPADLLPLVGVEAPSASKLCVTANVNHVCSSLLVNVVLPLRCPFAVLFDDFFREM